MLLALDTATATASIALYDLEQGRLMAELTWFAHRRQTQELMAAVERLLAQIESRADAVTALAVTTGPGSFTGVRIAVSAAKGFGLGLPKVPAVVGIPTLSVTAAPWLAAAGSGDPQTRVCAYIQAGRERFNWAFFDPGDLLWRPTAADHRAGRGHELAEDLRDCRHPVWLVGESTADLAASVAGLPRITCIDGESGLRRAGALARVAVAHLERGTDDGLDSLQPFYLREL